MVQAQPESGNDALNKFIQLYICTNHALHATDSEQRAYSTLVSRFSDKLASGQSIPADLQLAAKVAGGVLRKDSLIMGLMQSFVHMSEAAARGCVRTRTSKFMDREAVENAICTLGSSREAKHLLERFGCNSVALASHTWHHPALPEFFLLFAGCRCALPEFQESPFSFESAWHAAASCRGGRNLRRCKF